MTSKVSSGDSHDLSATEKPLWGGEPSAARNLPRKMTAEVMDVASIQTLSSAQTHPSSAHLETQECWAIEVCPELQGICSKAHDRISYRLILPEVSNLNGSIMGFFPRHFLPATWSPSLPEMLLLEYLLFFSQLTYKMWTSPREHSKSLTFYLEVTNKSFVLRPWGNLTRQLALMGSFLCLRDLLNKWLCSHIFYMPGWNWLNLSVSIWRELFHPNSVNPRTGAAKRRGKRKGRGRHLPIWLATCLWRRLVGTVTC